MGGHAYLAPSAASTWVNCPGYPSMTARFPSEDSAASLEGVKAHGVAAAYVTLGEQFAATCDGTPEMMEGAKMYADYVKRVEVEDGKFSIFRVENKIAATDVHPSECEGTPDLWAWSEEAQMLHVFDYKFGHGFVDAVKNWQMITYASGAAKLITPAEKLFKVKLHIIQPRCYRAEGPCRSWQIRSDGLAEYVRILAESASKATAENPRVYAGAHCTYCPARHVCPSLHRRAMESVDYSEEAIPLELDDKHLGAELAWLKDAKKTLETRLSGLEETVFSRVASGKNIPGWRVQQSQGRLEWTADRERILKRAGFANMNVLKEAELLTPTQVAKLGLVVSDLSERKSGKNELVPDGDATKYFS